MKRTLTAASLLMVIALLVQPALAGSGRQRHYPPPQYRWHPHYDGSRWGWYPWWSFDLFFPLFLPSYYAYPYPAPAYPQPPTQPAGAVAAEIQPTDAAIYVDQKYVGTAAELTGKSGYIYLAPGVHRFEAYLVGYETLDINVQIQPGRLFRVHRELTRTDDAGTPPGTSGESGQAPDERTPPRRTETF
jgi:hypothetical protein